MGLPSLALWPQDAADSQFYLFPPLSNFISEDPLPYPDHQPQFGPPNPPQKSCLTLRFRDQLVESRSLSPEKASGLLMRTRALCPQKDAHEEALGELPGLSHREYTVLPSGSRRLAALYISEQVNDC